MIRIETVFVRVSNIKKSTSWYKKVLQAKIKWQDKYISAIQLGESDLTLVQQELEHFKDITFNLRVDDINTYYLYLKQLDIDVTPITKWNDLLYFEFCDIDKNQIQIIQKL